ncbi:unnamed protein product [Adineta ricciae]|uniref:Cytochrome P450 n=1 Tax=Adineta ricciae TaxID=249248 RepID=A0A814I1H7_ADIRI|nr:unnamed protein product [Adineta ricciae]CAF1027306.1 unnamed protein product [Adineta ricciae]
MALLLAFGIALFILIISYVYFKRQLCQKTNGLPGPKPQILFGNLINSGILTGKKSFHEVMHQYQQEYGDKFVFWFGTYPILVFCSLEHAKAIFADRHTFEQSPLFLPNFELFCPHSIVTFSGSKWKRHARVMMPMFKRAKVIQHLDVIAECADRFIDQCLIADQVHTNLVRQCQTVTMNVIGFIAFDYDLGAEMNSKTKVMFEDFISVVVNVMFFSSLPQWVAKLYLKLNWKYQKTNRFLRELMENIVEQEQNNQDKAGEQERPKNLISSLVSSLNEQANDEQVSSGLTRAEMFDEVLTALVAGFETTATGLAWAIFFLSKNPHVQKRMKDELYQNDLLITDDVQSLPTLTKEKIDALVYCEFVIKEVLRLAPIASVTTRIALQDTVVDNTPVRRGQTVLIGMNNINTDARYWHHDDPKRFIPERYLHEDKDHHPSALLAFGGGHRACIGQDLAWLELKVVIIRLMQRGVTFEDTPENTGGYEERLTCFPKKMAIRVRFDRAR